jgi:hypothetical protein
MTEEEKFFILIKELKRYEVPEWLKESYFLLTKNIEYIPSGTKLFIDEVRMDYGLVVKFQYIEDNSVYSIELGLNGLLNLFQNSKLIRIKKEARIVESYDRK